MKRLALFLFLVVSHARAETASDFAKLINDFGFGVVAFGIVCVGVAGLAGTIFWQIQDNSKRADKRHEEHREDFSNLQGTFTKSLESISGTFTQTVATLTAEDRANREELASTRSDMREGFARVHAKLDHVEAEVEQLKIPRQ